MPKKPKDNRGGARKNAGRKPLIPGLVGKQTQFRLYPGEKEKIQEFLKKLRTQ